MARLKTAVLISGRGSNLQSLIDAAGAANFPATIALVVSNLAEAFGLERARRAGIATEIVSHRGHARREDFERLLDECLRAHGIEFVCLAGFMRLLTAWFVERWRDRLINIHPSLLPAFPGLDTHARALAAGTRFGGCTVHFVRAEMDAGPIIVQAAVPIRSDDTADSLAARVLEEEHRIFPLALRLCAEKRAVVDGNAVRILGATAPTGSLINPPG
ncbi:MAG: phosphoribosylglycinamide formyltransferase [Alphaproteobacteria bacterium]|nr:phosphoribosylglycinamide formyltransferase [Alphaproteobacteria bacterium]